MPDYIGFLTATTPQDWTRYIQWFNGALKHNIQIKRLPVNGAKGNPQEIAKAATYFANDPDCKVIVTAGTGAALACKLATQTKPFVFASVGDPTLTGLVPGVDGNNFTGGNNRQAVQRVVYSRVDYMLTNPIFQEPFAVIGNNENGKEPANTAMNHAYDRLFRYYGKVARLRTITPHPQDYITTFISALAKEGIQSLYVCSDLYLTVYSTALNKAAHHAGMRTMFEFEEHKYVHGADDYYGSDFQEMFTKAASYVDDILDGAKPGGDELPIYTAALKGNRPWPMIPMKKKKGSSRNKK